MVYLLFINGIVKVHQEGDYRIYTKERGGGGNGTKD
jgi:hypothetical protein